MRSPSPRRDRRERRSRSPTRHTSRSESHRDSRRSRDYDRDRRSSKKRKHRRERSPSPHISPLDAVAAAQAASRSREAAARAKRLVPDREDVDEDAYLSEHLAHLIDDNAAQEDEERAYKQKIFDALGEDEGVDPWLWDAQYSGPEPQDPNSTTIHTMTDDEYADYIRRGIWERSHKEDIARAEEGQRRRAQQHAERQRARQAFQSEEAKRMAKLRAETSKVDQKKLRQARAAYAEAWASLLSGETALRRADDISWPVLPTRITLDALRYFLLDGEPEDQHKRIVRSSQRIFHPDRFSRWLHILPSNEQQSTREKALKVSQYLNDLLSDTS
ncbi:uncharacterized protein L969DRAFT_18403 [Mixia osmundae IAM 14324]|uniref:NF-kappa-B inhibitor-like protein 1 n=1 Tax=Mixia osmundae (strain CBS 9802 / IAM 14324 / JCM 22182 / KY 12970) TaxID=764103 RepID=G7E7H6_MIXOS|nr:uncharacterized protein L969DRAFT_18403 [Mixia osmundae IAM 14324]KEI38389.1 hypothetical protein L969DRAFT_18403 [Mixia osmundae IAM 14324]GAA98786.1 hypothetical protein E5Q_05474 [Mixia osmundae IAM 14324]